MPLNNYLKNLAEQKRICPRCHENELEILPIGQGVRDWGVEVCYECGYSNYVYAPKNACIGNDPTYNPYVIDKEDEKLTRVLKALLIKSLNHDATEKVKDQETTVYHRSEDTCDNEQKRECVIIKPTFRRFDK
ncbi:hypothetical protein [Adlercreutzia agrestimuris]|uniref:hypothetical protein n=1 Tax=Adlercreutzia agrestimuris TaxID=2941324 RepID=UPI0020404492|nr:hypothetical protein [Adlercreutzia agrestimuris]